MLKPYDQHERISEQDYGPWMDRLSLYEKGGTFYLKEEWGYSKPYDKQWYLLSGKPKKKLGEAFADYTNGALCGGGNQDDFEEELEVSMVECDNPDSPQS